MILDFTRLFLPDSKWATSPATGVRAIRSLTFVMGGGANLRTKTMFGQSIEVVAEPDVLFNVTQDYTHRFDWDPFLKEARLIDGAESPGVGVRAWCVARNGLGMETRYVSFNPPGACAVEMTRGPWCLRSFSGSWRFEGIGPGQTRVTFTYSLAGRPTFISGLLRLVFARETRRRLGALKRFIESKGA